MKKIKDFVSGNIADKLYQTAHTETYPRWICLFAYILYYADICIFYIFTPFALGGFSYLFYVRKNYITAIFALFLFLCTCLFVYTKISGILQKKNITAAR